MKNLLLGWYPHVKSERQLLNIHSYFEGQSILCGEPWDFQHYKTRYPQIFNEGNERRSILQELFRFRQAGFTPDQVREFGDAVNRKLKAGVSPRRLTELLKQIRTGRVGKRGGISETDFRNSSQPTKGKLIRATEDEWRRWEEAAESSGQSLTDWIRAAAETAAERA